jgi:hypothetical protein
MPPPWLGASRNDERSPLTLGHRGVLRDSRWDALPVSLAAAHGLLDVRVPVPADPLAIPSPFWRLAESPFPLAPKMEIGNA